MQSPRKKPGQTYNSSLYAARMRKSSPNRRTTKKMFLWRSKRIRLNTLEDHKAGSGTPFFYWNGKKIGCCTRRINPVVAEKMQFAGSFVEKPTKEIYAGAKKSNRGTLEAAPEGIRRKVIKKIFLGSKTMDTTNTINLMISVLKKSNDTETRKKAIKVLETKAIELAMPKELLEKLKSIGSE